MPDPPVSAHFFAWEYGWSILDRMHRDLQDSAQTEGGWTCGSPLLDSGRMALTKTPPSSAEAEQTAGFWTRHTATLVAAALYVLCTAGVLIGSWVACEHHFIYPLDDTYITMSMARNLALHAIWGVTPYGFSSSNSSPIFPPLLALFYRLFGVNRFTPLVLSWIFGFATIFVAERIVARFFDRKGQTLVLILLVLFAPLFVVGVLGMEHSLHVLFTVLFLGFFLRDSLDEPPRDRLWQLGIVTAIMVAARYEGLFFVLPAGCALVLERRWKSAFAMSLGAALPVVAYAVFSLAHGGYWLPNSVAVKGLNIHHPGIVGAMLDALTRFRINCHDGFELPLMLAGVAVAAIALLRKSPRQAVPLAMVLVAGCLHLALAQVGLYYRYEPYLFAAGTLCVCCTFPALRRLVSRPVFTTAYFMYLISAAAMLMLSIAQLHMLPLISRNIYLRQWQMGRFVAAYYPGGVVAANDIGAINYLSNVHCYDLVGLANRDVFLARRSGHFTTQFIAEDAAAAHVQIAIVYDRWYADPPPSPIGGPSLPKTWIRVGRWNIPDPSIIDDHVVSFYAVDPREAPALHDHLEQFAPQLPKVLQLCWH